MQHEHVDPDQVEALYQRIADGALAGEPDPLTRYKLLTIEQDIQDALVSRIKRARGEALAELKAGGMTLKQIAEAAGIDRYQRVQQLIDPSAKTKKPGA